MRKLHLCSNKNLNSKDKNTRSNQYIAFNLIKWACYTTDPASDRKATGHETRVSTAGIEIQIWIRARTRFPGLEPRIPRDRTFVSLIFKIHPATPPTTSGPNFVPWSLIQSVIDLSWLRDERPIPTICITVSSFLRYEWPALTVLSNNTFAPGVSKIRFFLFVS